MTQLRKGNEARGLNDFSPLWCGVNIAARRKSSAGEITLALMESVRCDNTNMSRTYANYE